MAKKTRKTEKATAATLAAKQREISIAEFFTKNRHLLGFDSPRRALLTTIKEGVDNSLDACEEAGIAPDLQVMISPVDGRDDRYRVIIEDNGPGILKKQIPNIFAKLLYGSKFHRLKMSRGQQGIGISAAGMYGQLTTGMPVRILSKPHRNKPAHYYELMIDTQKNAPRTILEEERPWNEHTGTQVVIDLEAEYRRGRQSVEEYLLQTSIANPHVQITYTPPDGPQMIFPRITEQLPDEPREIKPHPYGVELGMLMKMAEATKARNLKTFLRQDFSRVSDRVALEICREAGLSETMRPSRIDREAAEKLIRAVKKVKIHNPPTDCISPIGQELIHKSLQKMLDAEFYAAVTRSPAVYRGNPFLVEAGIAYGGKELSADKPARLVRLANRVPLLYQQGACAITKSVSSTSWKGYGLNQPAGSLPIGPMLIMVHVASVWVPFTSESKEAIAHYPEIIKEIRLALQECGRKLAAHLRRQRRAAEEHRKRSYIEKYIPHIGIALKDILALDDAQEQRVVETLTGVLERSRKG